MNVRSPLGTRAFPCTLWPLTLSRQNNSIWTVRRAALDVLSTAQVTGLGVPHAPPSGRAALTAVTQVALVLSASKRISWRVATTSPASNARHLSSIASNASTKRRARSLNPRQECLRLTFCHCPEWPKTLLKTPVTWLSSLLAKISSLYNH